MNHPAKPRADMPGELEPFGHPPIGGANRKGESRKVPGSMGGRTARDRPHQRQDLRGRHRTPGDHRVPMDGKGPSATLVRIAVGAEKAHASGVAACGCLQVTMGDNRGRVAAVRAAPCLDLNAQVQKLQGVGLVEAAEFHAGTLSCHANPHYRRLSQVGGLNKTGLSVFHGPNTPSPTTVQRQSQ